MRDFSTTLINQPKPFLGARDVSAASFFLTETDQRELTTGATVLDPDYVDIAGQLESLWHSHRTIGGTSLPQVP
jgi:hypothetical protein